MSALLLALVLSTEPTPPTAKPVEPAPCYEVSFTNCFGLSIGLGVFGDAYPFSSVTAPDTGGPQRSLMGGARFWLGTRWANRFAVRGVFDFGYATVGPFPTRGSDGIIEAAGLELTLDSFSLIKPFVRFMYNAVIARIAAVVTGKDDRLLANNAFFVHAGAMLSVVEVHLSVGRDLSGGVSPGLGFSVAWIY